MATPTSRSASPRPAQLPPDQIDPRWLLRALAVTILGAAILGYLAVCLLVYMGSRQMLLHPTAAATPTPTIPFTPVHFDSAATGSPQLTAWWIPADVPSIQTPKTILLLHDGRGSLPATLPLITLLHAANVNVFAIDYRGFGASLFLHPTQQTMQQDSAAALLYLTATRHLPVTTIVPLGTGLGAVLAAELTRANPTLPALIVDNPDLTTVPALLAAPRARFLPMRYLLADHFDLTPLLKNLPQPTMLILGGPTQTTISLPSTIAAFTAAIPHPALTLNLPTSPPDPTCATCPDASPQCSACPGPAVTAAITRFLDSIPTQRTQP